MKSAGYALQDGKMAGADGKQLAIALTIQTKEQEKVALHLQRSLEQIGVALDVRTVDSAQYTRITSEFDFDMVPFILSNSLSPGTEQKNFWLSASAALPGSRNLAGAADPAIDKTIDILFKAATREELVDAVRALDRQLVNNAYLLPFYDLGGQLIARWNTIGRPEQQPLPGFEATTLWHMP